MTWNEAVREAIRRLTGGSPTTVFTRQELLAAELDQILVDTGSQGLTPEQTISRELQALRNNGEIDFVDDQGTYRIISLK